MNEQKAARYHRLQRIAEVLSIVWGAALLLTLLTGNRSLRLRSALEAWLGPISPDSLVGTGLVVAGCVVVLAACYEALALPIAFYQEFLLERRFGLSRQPARRWLQDHAK